MSYNVTFTESVIANPLKQPIVVSDKTVNTQTSMSFVGLNSPSYAQHFSNNFLHLLENFANSTPPSNPVQGQLWFDNQSKQLKVNIDGTPSNWISTGSVYKQDSQPSTATNGDIWVDTINQQLNIYSSLSSKWTLVGPLYSSDTITGQVIENIYDVNDTQHSVISLYSNNTRVAVLSASQFTPKITIPGFGVIRAGITLINTDSISNPGQTQSSYRFYGTSSDSDRLGGVLASSYIRSDQPVVINNGSLSVRTAILGNDLNLSIGTDSVQSSNYLLSTASSNSLEFRLNSNTVMFMLPDGKIGVAKNNPQYTFDVNGTASSTNLVVSGSGAAVTSGTQTASVQAVGGLYVAKNIVVGTNITVKNGVLELSTNAVDMIVAKPGETNKYDIGSSDNRFKDTYSQNFIGDLIGNVTGTVYGNVNGNVTGSAGSLNVTTNFNISGDMSSNLVSYNGTSNTVGLISVLTNESITSKPVTTQTYSSDQFLIYRSGSSVSAEFTGYIQGNQLTVVNVTSGTISVGTYITGNGILSGTIIIQGSGSIWYVNNNQTVGSVVLPVSITGTSNLHSINKQTFLSTVPTVKTGMISLYPVNSVLPTGYLKCDGTHYLIANYTQLYAVLGTTYLVNNGLNDTFAVPNLTAPSGMNYVIFNGYV